MRALYQRKKGRDLFDIYMALLHKNTDTHKVVACFKKYMEFVVERAPSYKKYVQNMEEKMRDEEFLTDVVSLLRPEVPFNPEEAYKIVYGALINKLPGKRD